MNSDGAPATVASRVTPVHSGNPELICGSPVSPSKIVPVRATQPSDL